jgi:hypothetical protein
MRAGLRSHRLWKGVALAFVGVLVAFSFGPFGLLLLGVFVVPAILAYTLGGTWRRTGSLVLLGAAIAAALFFAAYFRVTD